MNIALFGGTFDPIHVGHLRAAQAAANEFSLDRILFVPSGSPPHKHRLRLTPFIHRYAMVSLACAGDSRLVPSPIESPHGSPRFSVDTVQRIMRSLDANDHLFFLVGLDAFLDVPQWKQPSRLLDLVDFIVVSRPGSKWGAVMAAIPRSLLKESWDGGRLLRHGGGNLDLRRTRIHLLGGVNARVSSSDIRKRFRAGRRATGLIPRLVEEYILKEGIYRNVQESHC